MQEEDFGCIKVPAPRPMRFLMTLVTPMLSKQEIVREEDGLSIDYLK